jgi:hypothetical protein
MSVQHRVGDQLLDDQRQSQRVAGANAPTGAPAFDKRSGFGQDFEARRTQQRAAA